MVHFDRSIHFSRSIGRPDRNVRFHLTKLLSPVPLFCILLTTTITKRALALGRDCATGMYLLLGAWIFRNFKPELLLNGKRPLSSTASLVRAWPKQCWKRSCKRIQKKCWEFKRLTCFKFSATTCNRVCKRTQHIHATMLSPFARGFRGKRNQTRALQHDGFVPQEYTNELQRDLSRGPVNFSLIYNWW